MTLSFYSWVFLILFRSRYKPSVEPRITSCTVTADWSVLHTPARCRPLTGYTHDTHFRFVNFHLNHPRVKCRGDGWNDQALARVYIAMAQVYLTAGQYFVKCTLKPLSSLSFQCFIFSLYKQFIFRVSLRPNRTQPQTLGTRLLFSLSSMLVRIWLKDIL